MPALRWISPSSHLSIIYHYHNNYNLYKGNIQSPTSTADVLGLGLNFCVETPYPHTGQNYTDSLKLLHRSIQLFNYLNKFNNIPTTDDKDEYEP